MSSSLNYFSGQLGQLPPKADPNAPKPEPSKTTGQTSFTNEWGVFKNFIKNAARLLRKRVPKRECEVTIVSLQDQLSERFPTENLPLVTDSLALTDKDGIPLLYFLKGALRWVYPRDKDVIEHGRQMLEKFVQEYPPPTLNIDASNQTASGVHHLAIWHSAAYGTKLTPEALASPSKGAVFSIHLGQAFAEMQSAAFQFISSFTPVTQAIGAIFRLVDLANYERYHDLLNRMADCGLALPFRTSSYSCFLGMSIWTNLSRKPHRSTADTADGWTVNVVFGNFEGGHLEVPQLGQKFDLRPGDVLFMRPALLQHSISPFTGTRYEVVYFTHQSLQD